MKYKLQLIISGKSEVRFGTIIQAASSYLKRSQGSSQVAEKFKLVKKQETEILAKFIDESNLWVSGIDLDNYVFEGAEQKVYLK